VAVGLALPLLLLLLLPLCVHAYVALPLACLVCIHPVLGCLSLDPHCKSIISFYHYCFALTLVFGVKKTYES
jgi:hypothetical protein